MWEPYRHVPSPVSLRRVIADTVRHIGFREEARTRNLGMAATLISAGFALAIWPPEWLDAGMVLLVLVGACLLGSLVPEVFRGRTFQGHAGFRVRILTEEVGEELRLRAVDPESLLELESVAVPLDSWCHRAGPLRHGSPAFAPVLLRLVAGAYREARGEHLTAVLPGRIRERAVGATILGLASAHLEARGLRVRTQGRTLSVPPLALGLGLAFVMLPAVTRLPGGDLVALLLGVVVSAIITSEGTRTLHVIGARSGKLRLTDLIEAGKYSFALKGPDGARTRHAETSEVLYADLGLQDAEALGEMVDAALEGALGEPPS
ncbi:MAG: hypothetical protein ACYS99_05200 [Planctomycetota bacterium]|jgi:hypothetical protein